jgi:hypothetical protein
VLLSSSYSQSVSTRFEGKVHTELQKQDAVLLFRILLTVKKLYLQSCKVRSGYVAITSREDKEKEMIKREHKSSGTSAVQCSAVQCC